MKTAVITATLFSLSGTAYAGIPFLNATCPGNIEVHADEGGPIYINGKEGKLKRYNDNAYDAKGGGVTISLTIRPDGSPEVMYTGKGGANGICAIAGHGSAGQGTHRAGKSKKGECPPDVSEADRYKYPGCN